MSKLVLVVDDEQDVRTFLTAVLKRGGYETVTARNGVEALEEVRKKKADLVCLDLEMPEKTGTDFFRQLSKDKALSDIPIIVVSGLAGRHLAIRKPAAVFDKPIDPEEFLEACKKAIGD